MIRLTKTFALLLTLAFPAWAGDHVVLFDEDDPKMNAAITAARATLDQMLAHTLDNESASDPETTLKVSFPVFFDRSSQIGNEIIWVSHIRRKGETFTGLLANDPVDIPKLHHGSKVTFTYDQIRDWGFWGTDGKRYGHYTTRVMIPQLSPDQAASVKNYLSRRPLPKGW